MKKFFLLTVCMAGLCSVLSTLHAAPVDRMQAQSTARDFLAARGVSLNATAPVHKAMRKAAAEASAAYYVFNAADGQGYVIVSGDDRTEPILGYVDRGSYDESSMPENMRAWLEGYARQIEQLDQMGVKAGMRAPRRAAEQARKSVAPMLTSRWGQYAPYNNYTPQYGGSHNPTGCGATALAQVLYYHREQSKAQGITTLQETTSTYTISWGTGFNPAPQQQKGSPIDWDNMIDDYKAGATSAQKEAVAKLMIYCGAAIKMGYSNNGSGSLPEDVPAAVVKYFGYDGACAYKNKACFSIRAWDDMVYNEMVNHRPVIYYGEATGEGNQDNNHIFVIDGYDPDGFYHVNWGWNGDNNGYFVLNVLNYNEPSSTSTIVTNEGYTRNQACVIGLQPYAGNEKESVTPVLTAIRTSLSETEAKFTVENNTGEAHYFVAGIGYLDEKGDAHFLRTWNYGISNGIDYSLETNGVDFGFATNKSVIDVPFVVTAADMAAAGLTPGSYRLVPMSRCRLGESWAGEEWKMCQGSLSDHILLEYDGSKTVMKPWAKLSVESITYQGNLKAGQKQTALVTIKNEGEDFMGDVYLFFNFSSWATNEPESSATLNLEAGKTAQVSLTFKPGNYDTGVNDIRITIDEAGENIIAEDQVTITSGSSSTSVSLEAVGIDINALAEDGKTVYGTAITGKVHVKNTGSEAYNEVIYIEVRPGDISNREKLYNPSAIAPGETAAIPFKIERPAGEYTIKFINNQFQGIKNGEHTYTLAAGIDVFYADGRQSGIAKSDKVTIPEDVVAVDLRSANVSEVVTNSNPNALYYIAQDATVPATLQGKNIIKGSTAEAIALEENHDLYVPYAFTAQAISYTMKPTVGTTGTGGWQTLVLPFEVSGITADGAAITWQKNRGEKDFNFWLRQFSAVKDNNSVVFGYSDRMEAYTPYIVAFPSDKWGEAFNLVGKTVVFSGTDAMIAASPRIQVSTSELSFVGTTTQATAENAFVLNEAGDNFDYAATTNVKPFSAYFRDKAAQPGAGSRLKIVFDNGDNSDVATAIMSMHDAQRTADNEVFDLQGRRVAQPSKGLYIVNGKKVIIK